MSQRTCKCTVCGGNHNLFHCENKCVNRVGLAFQNQEEQNQEQARELQERESEAEELANLVRMKDEVVKTSSGALSTPIKSFPT